MSESNAVRTNTMFGDYDIIETVGQGGMGVVYRATDTNLNREVALKVLKDDLREHSAVVARFQREAEAYATLNHPNIVHIFSVGAVGKIPYIAMQMIHGTPLSALMKKERRLEWKRALNIGIQVAEALGSAHSEHIIHRDIKPGNVLVAADDYAYVTDFGIAKVLTAETQLTVEGSRLGTPQYMSPERCKNEEVTATSDLYSLGVLLFQMITGRLPYESKDPVELVRKIVSDPPQRMRDFMPDVPEDVERLIAYLIEKKPENRPQSAEEWVLLCQRVIDGKPLVEDDSGLEESLRQFRETQTTPTPIGQPYAPPKKDNVARKLQSRFEGMSANQVTGVAALIAIVIAGLAGFLVSTSMKPDRVPEIASALGTINTDWRSAERLVQFRNEMPGVSLIEMGNPNLLPTPVTSAGDHGLLVFLRGNPESEWAGRQGIMWIAPGSQGAQLAARLAVPPIAVESMRHVGTRSRDGAPLVDIEGQWYAVQEPTPERESGYSILGKTANDSLADISQVRWDGEHAVVVARDLAAGSAGIYRFLPGESVGAPIVTGRERIETLSLAGSNAVLWAESASDGSPSLYMAEGLDAATEPLRLITQMPTASSFDMHPGGDRVCAVRVNPDGTAEVVILNMEQPTLPVPVVNGLNARWHPTHDAVLVLAPDRKGIPQIWTVDATEPYQSRQVTFLQDGIRELGTTSGGQLIATSGSDAQPALVQIDFDQLR